MLEVIWRCFTHCQNYKRILVIDTRYVSTFKSDIHKYIHFTSDIIFKGEVDILFNSFISEKKSIYPDIFTKNKNDYKTIISKLKFTKEGYISYLNEKESLNISINLKKEYKEDVLLYANCIGGAGVLEIFKMCKFKPILKEQINLRLKKIKKPFISVHLRNTDRKSNISSFLKENEAHFKDKNIFVATDNFLCLEYMKDIYGSYIYSFANLPKDEKLVGKPIHENNNKLDKDEFVIDCISDFVMLCYGKEYYYSCKESGYSKNVLLLRDNMKVLENLLK